MHHRDAVRRVTADWGEKGYRPGVPSDARRLSSSLADLVGFVPAVHAVVVAQDEGWGLQEAC